MTRLQWIMLRTTLMDSSRRCAVQSKQSLKRYPLCCSIKRQWGSCSDWYSNEYPTVSWWRNKRTDSRVWNVFLYSDPEQPTIYYENINQLLKVRRDQDQRRVSWVTELSLSLCWLGFHSTSVHFRFAWILGISLQSLETTRTGIRFVRGLLVDEEDLLYSSVFSTDTSAYHRRMCTVDPRGQTH